MQQVEVSGQLSSKRPIEISVLQGSILGPILFLCYINDLWKSTDLLTFLFADDTSCLISGYELSPLIAKANFELNKIANWWNKVTLNWL